MKHQTLTYRFEDLDGRESKAAARPRLTFREKRILFRNLARMIQGGISLLRALEILLRDSKKRSGHSVLRSIANKIEAGSGLSEALLFKPALFSSFEMEMIRAGEISGSLEKVLSDLADQMEETERWRAGLREALAYPSFVILLGSATLAFLLTFVVPKMSFLYADLGAELPFLTRVVIQASSVGPLIFFFGVFALLAIFFCFKYRKDLLESLLEKIPVAGDLLREHRIVWFASLLALLLKSGISLFSSVAAMGGTASVLMKKALKTVEGYLREGTAFSSAARNLTWLSEETHALILAGEESGELAECLEEIARSHRQEFENKRTFILKFLEPALILVTGILVGLLVIAMLLPIFSVSFYVS